MDTITNLKVSDFDYNLPNELIAQNPLKERQNCRMMHLNKTSKTFEDKYFYNVIDYLNKGDVLVLNNTKVYPARLIAKRATGASVEIFLLNPVDNSNHWEALTKNAKRVQFGELLEIAPDFKVKIVEKIETKEGEVPKYIVELIYESNNIYDVLDKYGSIPLPPYISRHATKEDNDDYQTVYAKNIGSVAAPTAGLHFTKDLLKKIEQKGVKIAYVTLNVGLGTFMPVKVEEIKDHTMHFEHYTIPKETENLIKQAKKEGKSIVAVGTTTLRCLEATYKKYGKIVENTSSTNIFIYPPYEIKSINKLITNFHLPKSTLIMLVSALAGKDFIFEAYNHAIEEKYRFFSYGDCMFIE